MLKSGAKNGVPIDREDIIKAYIECMYGNSKTYCKAERMLNGDYTYKHLEISHQDPYIRIKSIAWFKNNLATCIIKGKVLAVPIIDIDA